MMPAQWLSYYCCLQQLPEMVAAGKDGAVTKKGLQIVIKTGGCSQEAVVARCMCLPPLSSLPVYSYHSCYHSMMCCCMHVGCRAFWLRPSSAHIPDLTRL
jgi:hypothetical protein